MAGILSELIKIGKDCYNAANEEYKLFKKECCDDKTIIECIKSNKDYQDMCNSINKLRQKRM
jgi:hypothetical protein